MLESTTYKFAKALQRDFGKIDGITDKDYITNSYHVHVTEKINAFDKITFESEFQELSPGGHFNKTYCSRLKSCELHVKAGVYNHCMLTVEVSRR